MKSLEDSNLDQMMKNMERESGDQYSMLEKELIMKVNG